MWLFQRGRRQKVSQKQRVLNAARALFDNNTTEFGALDIIAKDAELQQIKNEWKGLGIATVFRAFRMLEDFGMLTYREQQESMEINGMTNLVTRRYYRLTKRGFTLNIDR